MHAPAQIRLAVGVLCLGLCVAPWRPARASVTNTEDYADAYREMETFTRVMLQVKRAYVEDATYHDLMQGALKGLLESLDEHSEFMDAARYKDMREDTEGRFGGIGIVLAVVDGALVVRAPIEDTPAYRAGVLSGDQISEIDGKSTANMKTDDAIKLLRGEAGTRVTVSILRPGEKQMRKVNLVREQISVATVKGARMLRSDIGYVRITQFNAPTAAALAEALTRLRDKGMKALVMDLRNNPGGLLSSAVEVSGMFLKDNAPIVSTRGRQQVQEYRVKGGLDAGVRYLDIPVAILVNRWSASASEIVSGALQDNRRAVLVGEPTYGKGSVQSVVPLDDECAIRLTTARYHTPGARQIERNGIEPDIVVPVSVEEWQRVQIRRAVDENPAMFSDEEKKRAADAVDRSLERALDMLQAISVLDKRPAKDAGKP